MCASGCGDGVPIQEPPRKTTPADWRRTQPESLVRTRAPGCPPASPGFPAEKGGQTEEARATGAWRLSRGHCAAVSFLVGELKLPAWLHRAARHHQH